VAKRQQLKIVLPLFLMAMLQAEQGMSPCSSGGSDRAALVRPLHVRSMRLGMIPIETWVGSVIGIGDNE
jgi:hypothetical protein